MKHVEATVCLSHSYWQTNSCSQTAILFQNVITSMTGYELKAGQQVSISPVMTEVYRHVKCLNSWKDGVVTLHCYLVLFLVFAPQGQKDWFCMYLTLNQVLNWEDSSCVPTWNWLYRSFVIEDIWEAPPHPSTEHSFELLLHIPTT